MPAFNKQLLEVEAKKYRPEMLFEEPEIIERIKKHPMALWRCR